jgi:hypothetical protein
MANQVKRPRELGSYFLCNDLHIDWAYSFLVSFREWNPTMPLTLIPFDDRTNELVTLQKRFAFDILQSDLFPELEMFALELFGKPSGVMRKLAAFWGFYDHFFYLDTDIVITSDLMQLGQQIRESGNDLVYFDSDIEWVYHPGSLREQMISEYQTKAFNAGNWFSRRGLFSLEQLKTLAGQAQAVKEGMVCAFEQTFLNYCCDRARVKSALFSDLMKEYYFSTWYRNIRAQKVQGSWIQGTGEQAGRQLCMIHFAGQPLSPRMENYDLYLINRMKLRGFFATVMWNVRAHVRVSKIHPIYLKCKYILRRLAAPVLGKHP